MRYYSGDIALAASSCIEWLTHDLTLFRLERWRAVPALREFPCGPLIECLQVLSRVPFRLSSPSFEAERLIDFVYQELQCAYDSGFDNAYVDLGYKELGRIAMNYGVSSPISESRDFHYCSTGALLDDVYLADALGLRSPDTQYDQLFVGSSLASSTKLGSLSLNEAYLATHMAFYTTLFGDRHCVLAPGNTKMLTRLIMTISRSSLNYGYMDLLVECQAGLALIDPCWVNDDVCASLLGSVMEHGYLPVDTELDERSFCDTVVFDAAYHSNLAFLLLCTSLLKA